jgi:peroxiredoxin
MTLDNPGPVGKLGPNRCKRFGMYVVDGVVKVIQVSENKGGADDPAGDDFPEDSCIDNMLKLISEL